MLSDERSCDSRSPRADRPAPAAPAPNEQRRIDELRAALERARQIARECAHHGDMSREARAEYEGLVDRALSEDEARELGLLP